MASEHLAAEYRAIQGGWNSHACTTDRKKPGHVQELGRYLEITEQRLPTWARDPLSDPGPGTEASLVMTEPVQTNHRRA